MSCKKKSWEEIRAINREKLELFKKLDKIRDAVNKVQAMEFGRAEDRVDPVVANSNLFKQLLAEMEELNRNLEELLKEKEAIQVYLTQDSRLAGDEGNCRKLVGSYESQEMFKEIIKTLINLDLSNVKEVLKDAEYYHQICTKGDQIWSNAIKSTIEITQLFRKLQLPSLKDD